MTGKISLAIVFVFLGLFVSAQQRFSIMTDVALLRNFSDKHKFWSAGQTIQTNFHFTPKHTVYTWFKYFIPGKFQNEFIASATDPATIPQQIGYRVNSSWTFREISVGYKHYFRGSYNSSGGWNVYGLAGFGYMFAKTTSTSALDLSQYQPAERPVLGNRNFSRLNLDIGIGTEYALGANIYIYSDLITWINTSSFKPLVFHSDNNATRPLMLSGGIRLLFE